MSEHIQLGRRSLAISLRRWKNLWRTSLISAIGIGLFMGLTPSPSAAQNPNKGREKPPKERRDDPRDKDVRPDVKDKDQDRIPDRVDRVQDRVKGNPADVRVKGRAYVRPEVTARVNTYWNRIGPARRPFTASWYRSHPGAWRYSFAIRGPWAPAAYPAVARFVGISGAPVAYAYQSPSALTESQWAALVASAKSAEGAKEEDLMSLGVYSLLPPDASDSTTVVQLAISKEGHMAGSYYDALSDTGKPINGTLDRESQRVFWSIGENREVAFETGLENLTSESAPVTLHLKDGTMQKWSMIRVAEEGGPESPRKQ